MPIVRQLALTATRSSTFRAATPVKAGTAHVYDMLTASTTCQRRSTSQLSTSSNTSSLPQDQVSEVLHRLKKIERSQVEFKKIQAAIHIENKEHLHTHLQPTLRVRLLTTLVSKRHRTPSTFQRSCDSWSSSNRLWPPWDKPGRATQHHRMLLVLPVLVQLMPSSIRKSCVS
jgi:hypothetical protein